MWGTGRPACHRGNSSDRQRRLPDIRKISPFYAAVYDYIASQEFLDFVADHVAGPERRFSAHGKATGWTTAPATE